MPVTGGQPSGASNLKNNFFGEGRPWKKHNKAMLYPSFGRIFLPINTCCCSFTTSWTSEWSTRRYKSDSYVAAGRLARARPAGNFHNGSGSGTLFPDAREKLLKLTWFGC